MGGHSSLPGQKHLSRRAALRVFPGPALGRAGRRGALLRRAGRRRAAHAHGGAHGGALRRGRARLDAGRRVRARVRPRRRRAGARCRGRPHADASRPASCSTAPACGPTSCRRCPGARGRFRVRASKGVHIVVPRDRITGDAGLILRTSLVRAARHPVEEPLADRHDRHRLEPRPRAPGGDPRATSTTCSNASTRCSSRRSRTRTSRACTRDFALCWQGNPRRRRALSREHAVARVVPGLISIAGGKYTTYRVMAADAVDAASEDLPRRVAPSCTDKVPLLGARRLLRDAQPARHARRRVRPAPAPDQARARPVRVDDPRRARSRASTTPALLETVPAAPTT